LPSFSNLQQAAELKEACVFGHRLYKSYERAKTSEIEGPSTTRRGLSCSTLPLSLHTPLDYAELELNYIYVIPGGRYLVTCHGEAWLCVWDLAPVKDARGRDSEPTLLLRHSVHGFEYVELVEVSDWSSITFVLQIDAGQGAPS
jgi:hypothetical protein